MKLTCALNVKKLHTLSLKKKKLQLCNQFLKCPKAALFNAKFLHSSTLTCALMARAHGSTLDEITYVAPTFKFPFFSNYHRR